MKMPTLAALALAALAGAVPASAQFDMGAARQTLDSIRALKAAEAAKPPKKAPSRAPAVLPPSASDADWAKILERLKADGKYTPEVPPLRPGMFTLEETAGPKDGDHVTHKANAMGLLNDDEQFEVVGMVFAVEDWKKDKDGNWVLDQWLFETDVYGEVASVVHIAGVLTPDHKPLSGGPEKLSTSDPRIPGKFKSVIDHWAAPKP